MFDVVIEILKADLEFADKDGARSFFNNLRQVFLDWNGAEWESEKFKKLEEPFWELKSDENRLLCFKHKNCWILTNGFKKTTQKVKRRYINFAQRVMTEHLQRNP